MSFESKKKRLTKIVADKIHEYNEGKNHDLISVGDDIFPKTTSWQKNFCYRKKIYAKYCYSHCTKIQQTNI